MEGRGQIDPEGMCSSVGYDLDGGVNCDQRLSEAFASLGLNAEAPGVENSS